MLKIEQQKITLTKGDTAFIRFAPVYKDGTLYTTEVGDRAIFRLRENKVLIEIECSVDIANNEIIVAIQPTHTVNLKTGIHKYEVELLTGDGNYYTFIADQPFIIGNELEMHESGPAESILLSPANTSNIPTITGEVEGEPPVVSGVVQEGRPSQDYNRLYNKPTLNGVTIEGDKVSGDYNFGTAADLDVAEEGDASTEQVVKGDDTRLSDARPASDVSDWAKAPNKPQYTKAEVGLGNVDNTSDAVKKSDFTGHIAQGNTGFVTGDEAKSALDYKLNITQKGAPNGLAELDSSGKVPASQLPSYVDGTVEGYLVDETHFYKEDVDSAYYWEGNFYEDAAHTTPIVPKENVIYTDITTGTTFKWNAATSTYVLASRTLIPGEADKIYVDLYSNNTYRWSGTIFVEISKSLALGTNDNCAYYGGKGQQAYEHATDVKISEAVESGLYKVAGTAEGHIGSLTPVEKTDITALGIPAQDTTYENATAQTDGLMSKENYTKLSGLNEVVANPGNTSEALTSIGIGGTNYSIQGGGGGAVNSVNGKVGDVVLDASDVGALPDDTPLFSGSYNDLTDKPTLADLSDDSDHRTVTDAEKTQWNAAETNVQADWNQTTTSADDYIKNKPANLVQDANYVHTDNNFTNAYKTKLSDIEAGAEVNVQSDWNQTDNTADDYIKNKPAIPDPQIQSDWNQTSGTAKDYIKNKPSLGTASALDVATSGDASATQVVKGDDSRLSDARTPVSHTHTLSEITDAGTAASKNSTSSVTADSTDLVESGAVKTAIDNAISGAYKHAGTKTCAELISSLLIASNNGNVYNITDSGTTTSDFIEGAGIPIRAGDNVGIAKISDGVYKFDLLSGFIDTSNFITKSSTSGLVKSDGSIDTTEYAPASSIPEVQIQSDWDQSDNTKLDYIKNKPALGSAAAKNVPTSGNAGTSEVVMGNDTRLTDARNAADVYSWAKAENKPSYSKSEVGLGNVDNTSDATKKTNFTGSIASENTGFVTGGDAYTELAKKVDQVEGKVLSSNDFTDTLKNKLDGIAAGAEVNVQSDWNQATDTADDYIKNKPTKVSDFANDSGFTKVEASTTNGNIKIDSAETTVYDDSDIQELIDIDETETEYANPLTFETLQAQTAKNTKIKLDPIQDLHGYSKPWVGGAGKNLFGGTITTSGMSFNNGNATNTNTDTLGYFRLRVTLYKNGNSVVYKEISNISEVGRYSINFLFSYDFDTVEFKHNGSQLDLKLTVSISANSVISISFYVAGYNPSTVGGLILQEIQAELSSSSTTYEPYSNICPISGHETIELSGCGKNMIGNMEIASGTTGVAELNGDEIKVVSLSNGQYKASNFIWDILPSQWGKRIYISCASATSSGSNDWRINLRTSSDGINYTERINITGTLATKTMLIPENTVKMMLLLYSTSAVSGTAGDYVIYKKLQLEFNEDNATEYELPKQSNNLSIDIPSTVYGGVLDLESGEVVVNKGIVDLGSLGWDYQASSTRFRSGLVTNMKTEKMYTSDKIRCSILEPDEAPISGTYDKNGTISTWSDQRIYAQLFSYTDATEFKTAVTGQTLCYLLATPFTLYISPEQLKLLKSQNTITTSNYTQVKVTYRNGVFATLEELSDTTQDIYDEISGDTTTVSGNPINFTTREKQKAKSTIIDLEPIQDLHGFTKPWVGGAGKNKLPLTVDGIKAANTDATWTGNSTVINNVTFTILTDNDGNVTGINANGTANGDATLIVYGKSLSWEGNITLDSNMIADSSIPQSVDETIYNNIVWGSTNYIFKSNKSIPSGVVFYGYGLRILNGKQTSNIIFYPMIRLSTVTDSTFEPYTNICSISGRSEVNVDGCGKNLLPLTVDLVKTCNPNQGYWTGNIFTASSGITFTLETNSNNIVTGIKLNGQPSSSTFFYLSKEFIFDEDTYILSGSAGNGGDSSYTLRLYDHITAVVDSGNSPKFNSNIFVEPVDIFIRVQSGYNCQNVMFYPMLQRDNKDADKSYSSYQSSNQLTISLGTTVYGGRLNVEKGELVVDRAIVDMGDLNWTDLGTAVSGAARFKTTLTNKPVRSDLTNGSTSYCSHYDLLSEGGTYTANKDGYTISTTDIVFFVDAYKTSSTSAFKTAMSGVQVVYTLQDEYKTTIQLTPHQIQLLKGINNISTDGTTITVTYKNGSVAHLDDLPENVFTDDEKEKLNSIDTLAVTLDLLTHTLVITQDI